MTDLTIPKYTVIQYVRNKKRVPYGVLVAIKSNDEFTLGYSLCNKKDRFNKRTALKIAIERATVVNERPALKPAMARAMVPEEARTEEIVPREISKVMPAFFDRCKKYYKV